MKDYFNEYHPVVLFIYFISVIGLSMFLLHPTYLIISLSASLCYNILLSGKKAIKFNVLYMLPMMIIMAVVNPLFNHAGITILFYLPTGNPFTLESVIYGIASSMMLITIIIWFSCYNLIVTSDKLIYLFGKILPKISLLLTMILRFIPLYKIRIKKIIVGQNCLGVDFNSGKWYDKAKKCIKILSIMTSWSLESAIDTSDSMRARGYGLSNRTVFSNFKMSSRDYIVGGILLSFDLFIIYGILTNNIFVDYFPKINYNKNGVLDYIGYFIICYMPIMINCWEEIRWKYLISKI